MPGLACVVLSLRGERGVADAVRSLAEQEPDELVVVNTGGGDLPVGGVRVVEHPEPLLPGGARNLGVAATRARWVAFLAADCVALPGWVAARRRAHEAGARAVAGVMATPSGPPAAVAAHLALHHRRVAWTPSGQRKAYGLSYDRALLEALGPFREDLRTGEDTELNARLPPGAVVWVPEVRTLHRHPQTPRDLLRDQRARGARTRVALRTALAHTPLNAVHALRRALAAPGEERAALLRAWPLAVAASAAYAVGQLTASPGATAPGEAAGPSRR